MLIIQELCPTKTQEKIKSGALLVDVREKNEVAELAYDVPEIVNIPLTEFEERFRELPTDRELVIVCRSGGRSLRAAGFLLNNGYTDVINMKHGMIRWAQKGFPTIGDVSTVLDTAPAHQCCGGHGHHHEEKKEEVKKSDSTCC